METQEGIETMFQFATKGILIANSFGKITRINPAGERLFGYEKGELINCSVEKLIPEKLKNQHVMHREKFADNPHARAMGTGFDLKGIRKNGSEFPVEISLSPYETAEGKFVIAFIIDITLRKKAEDKLKNYSVELEKQVNDRTLILREAIDELEKTKEDLNEALAKEKELNDLKSRFVSMASHEFRTPLATILSSLSLIQKYSETNETEKQSKHYQRIKTSISNLTEILNDFLSISRLEEGKVSNFPQEFLLHDFISELIIELESLMKPNQKIIFSPMKKDATVFLDKKLLRHVLINLISNAIKFSEEGKSISVATSISKTEIKIAVKDEGIGISDEDKKHLFERFFRGHNASYIQGTGLGLNIVGKYVELMNGTLDVESEENKGSVFTIKFNLK